MSDEVERTRGLMGTDDAMVWAEEFCRIFNGHMILMQDEVSTAEGNVDEGTMVGWFANAMQVAIDIDKARRKRIADATASIPTTTREAFVEGFEDGREIDES